MAELNTRKPEPTEYASDYGKYIELVAAGDIVATLKKQLADTTALLGSISEEQAAYRYAPDKWSIKQLVGHLIDGERIFAYRALRFARNDQTPLNGFEQDDYVANGPFDNCAFSDLAAEFAHVRHATVSLLEHLTEEDWKRKGLANDSEVSVRALAHIIAGHELHHIGIVRTKYLRTDAAAN